MRGMEFAELTAFMAVAEHKNFARAAAMLDLSPSTLSQIIRALESRLGVRLLHRTTRHVSLTEVGEHFLRRIRPAFDELHAATESINDFRDTPMGTLKLSVSSIPAQMILAPLLKDFLHAYPAIQLEISVDNINTDIVEGQFDAGIRYGRQIAQDMQLVTASPPSRIIAVASPDYLAHHTAPVTPDDLQTHACIRLRMASRQLLAWSFEKAGNTIELLVNGPLIVNDVDLLIKAVRDGIGIGYMVESYIAEDIRQQKLIPLLEDWSPPYHGWYLYYAGRRHLSAPLKAFISFLRERVQQQSA